MSLFDMFRTTPPAGAAANPTVPGNTGGVDPAAQAATGLPNAIPPAAEGEKSPLANFEKLWEVKPEGAAPISFSPEFGFDRAKVGEAAKGLDFRKVVDPALAQKALQGDMSAFMEVLNAVGQAGFAQSVTAAGLMSQEVAKRTGSSVQAALPGFLKMQQAGQDTRSNEFFNNPAVTPLMTNIQNQLAAANPNATAAEIAEQTKQYFAGMAEAYVQSTGKTVADAPKVSTRQQDDWSNYLS